VKDDLIKLRDEFIQARSGLENKDSIFKLESEITAVKDDLKHIHESGYPINTPQQNVKP
jgi:hypothetical protein